MSAALSTPEFVRWAIAQTCPLREFSEWQEPEQVERRLRPLRAYSEALSEKRLFEGVCLAASVRPGIDPAAAKGFRAAEILDGYGGANVVSEACAGCQANVPRAAEEPSLVGCYGHLEFSGLESLHADLAAVAAKLRLAERLAEEFVATTPLWYGLWVEPAPRGSQLELLGRLLSALGARSAEYRRRLGAFPAAIERCLTRGLTLRLTLVPRGEYTATRWKVAAHCGRCKAGWPPGARRCLVCGQPGKPVPERNRHARGDRPYWRLAGFLGADNVGPFLERYFETQRA